MKTVCFYLLLFLSFLTNSEAIAQNSKRIKPHDIVNLCPNTRDGHLKRGNLEFGNLPNGLLANASLDVTVQVTVKVVNSMLLADVYLKMESLPDVDRSTLEARFTDLAVYPFPHWQKEVNYVATAPIAGFKLPGSNRFVTHATSTYRGKLPLGGSEFIGCNDGTPYTRKMYGGIVDKIILIGDTGANDISTDRDCGCDSKVVRISFKHIDINYLYKINNRALDQQIHIEYGTPQVTKTPRQWWSARWSFERIPGTTFYRIKNRWKNTYLNLNNSTLSTSHISASIISAHWQLIPAGNGYFRIRNRQQLGRYLNIKNGRLVAGLINHSSYSGHWKLNNFF